MSAQKVLMIGWEYPPHNSGGLGVACQGLTESLAGANTQIYFTLPHTGIPDVKHMSVVSCVHPQWQNISNYDSSLPPFFAYDSFTQNELLGAQKPKIERNTSSTNHLHLDQLPQSQMEAKVSEYAHMVATQPQAHRTQVIHAHDWMSFPAGMAVKQQTGQPLITHVHSTEFDRVPHGSGSAFIKHTEYKGLHAADHVIAVSAYTKRIVHEQYGVPLSKISVVHNGIDAPSTNPDPGTHHFAHHRPTVVFMGRLTMQKGGEFFLKVAQKVRQQFPTALFIVAGDGDMYRQLLFSAAYDQLTACVLFTGFLRGRERERLLDRADVFVMPSVSEPFGLVALEAAQRHTPVIVSKTSGVAEVLPSAVSIDFWDIEKMSEALCLLLSSKKVRKEQVSRQLQELEALSWHKAAMDVKKIYRSVMLGV